MSTTTQQVGEFLDLLGIKYDKPEEIENLFLVIFTSQNYVYQHSTGEQKRIGIFIEIEESGELINFTSWKIYTCPSNLDKNKKLALFQTLLEIQNKFKLVKFAYDSSEGYISIRVSVPLEDAKLTPSVLNRCIKIIPECLDRFHSDITEALNEGLLPESEESKQKALEEFQQQRRQQRREQFGD